MTHTVIARRAGAGTLLAGTATVTTPDDARTGARGWWGGLARMSEAQARQRAARINVGGHPDAPADWTPLAPRFGPPTQGMMGRWCGCGRKAIRWVAEDA